MADRDLTSLETHFAFGANWESFAERLDEAMIGQAVAGLSRLVPPGELRGRTFLDVGCGSGLHSLAALRMGASRVRAVDFDPRSVSAARSVLARFAPGGAWDVSEASALELGPQECGTFDIVYSWGVLHHTGAMREALHRVSGLVANGGLLVLALYRRTALDRAWRWEKRIYSASPRSVQAAVRFAYVFGLRLRFLIKRRSFTAHRQGYRSHRGMSFTHDLHDWLGGYPCETITPEELDELVARWGFEGVRRFVEPGGLGLFGSGCDEFVYQRTGPGSTG